MPSETVVAFVSPGSNKVTKVRVSEQQELKADLTPSFKASKAPTSPIIYCRALISFLAAKKMGHRFNDIAETLGIHPVTAGRCAEKGKKLVDNDDRIWEILEKCS